MRAHRLQFTLVGARAFPETCAIEVLGTDHLKTTAFELSNEQLEYLLAGSRHNIAVQDIGRCSPCRAESRRRYSYSVPQACLRIASRSGPPILM